MTVPKRRATRSGPRKPARWRGAESVGIPAINGGHWNAHAIRRGGSLEIRVQFKNHEQARAYLLELVEARNGTPAALAEGTICVQLAEALRDLMAACGGEPDSELPGQVRAWRQAEKVLRNPQLPRVKESKRAT
jgi:hypothetical protein